MTPIAFTSVIFGLLLVAGIGITFTAKRNPSIHTEK